MTQFRRDARSHKLAASEPCVVGLISASQRQPGECRPLLAPLAIFDGEEEADGREPSSSCSSSSRKDIHYGCGMHGILGKWDWGASGLCWSLIYGNIRARPVRLAYQMYF